MEEFRSLTMACNNSVLDAFSYIESLLSLFNRDTGIVGKVVSGLVETLEDEKKKAELLRAWNDHKAKVSYIGLFNLCITITFENLFYYNFCYRKLPIFLL